MLAERGIQFPVIRNTGRETPQLDEGELEHLRKEVGMTVKGADVPYPIMKLSEAELPDAVHKIMKKRTRKGGLSPLEGQVWSTLMSGRDAVVVAAGRFGHPRTNLFLPPAITHTMKEKQSADERHPIVLILCNNEKDQNIIRQNYDLFCDKIGTSVESRGENTNSKDKLCFCFASPQGLLNLLESKEVTLEKCNYVILYNLFDMFEKGYEAQVRKVFKMFPTKPQIVILSFKWNVLMQSLADEILSNYVFINIAPYRAVKSLSFPNNLELKQEFFMVKETNKYDELKKIIEKCMLKENCKIVVYATFKKTVFNVSLFLQGLSYSVGHLHFGSSLDQHQYVLEKFKKNRKSIVVLSSKAEYLLKVGDIDFAVNFDFPSTSKLYLSRVEKKDAFRVLNTVYSFITKDNYLNLDSNFWTLLYQENETIMQNLILLMKEEEQPEFLLSETVQEIKSNEK